MGCCTRLNFLGVLAPFSLKCTGFLTVMEVSEGESGLDSMGQIGPASPTRFCLSEMDNWFDHASVLGYIMEDPSTGSVTRLNIIHQLTCEPLSFSKTAS